MMVVRFTAIYDPSGTCFEGRLRLHGRITAHSDTGGRIGYRCCPHKSHIRFYSSCRRAIVAGQYILLQADSSITAQFIQDTGRNHVLFIPDRRFCQSKARISQPGQLSFHPGLRCRPAVCQFRLEGGDSLCRVTRFIPKSQAQISPSITVYMAIDWNFPGQSRISCSCVRHTVARYICRYGMAAQMVFQKIRLISAVETLVQLLFCFSEAAFLLCRRLTPAVQYTPIGAHHRAHISTAFHAPFNFER